MSKFLALLCLIAAALFIGGTVADTCLSYPGPLGRGAGCGGFLPCRQGLACSEEGVCVPRTREGEDCEDIPCEAGLSCMGPEDAQRCVAPVHPGQDCVQSNGYSGPRCGTGYCDDGRCRGGMIGDACYEDDDCSGDLTCTERICTGLAVGAECTDTSSCVVGSYCHSVTGLCTALPTSGNCTLFSGQCAYGYSCINPSDEALFPQCVAHSSIPDGGYCDGNRDVCLNKRCYDDYCAAASPKYCDNSYQCAGDEACTCGGDSKLSGIGSCKAVACTKHFKAYDDCFSQNCRADTYFNGSCIQRNCDAEYRKNEICSSASSLFVSLLSASFFSLFVSLLSASFFALFVSFLGKHF